MKSLFSPLRGDNHRCIETIIRLNDCRVHCRKYDDVKRMKLKMRSLQAGEAQQMSVDSAEWTVSLGSPLASTTHSEPNAKQTATLNVMID